MATDGANAGTLGELKASLECGHVCPQGPVQVPMVPQADPFVIPEDNDDDDATPWLYVAGNCATFATSMVRVKDRVDCRLVCVPEFCSTGVAVLVDLETLDVELLRMEVESE